MVLRTGRGSAVANSVDHQRCTLSGSASGVMPWPRLKMCGPFGEGLDRAACPRGSSASPPVTICDDGERLPCTQPPGCTCAAAHSGGDGIVDGDAICAGGGRRSRRSRSPALAREGDDWAGRGGGILEGLAMIRAAEVWWRVVHVKSADLAALPAQLSKSLITFGAGGDSALDRYSGLVPSVMRSIKLSKTARFSALSLWAGP